MKNSFLVLVTCRVTCDTFSLVSTLMVIFLYAFVPWSVLIDPGSNIGVGWISRGVGRVTFRVVCSSLLID